MELCIGQHALEFCIGMISFSEKSKLITFRGIYKKASVFLDNLKKAHIFCIFIERPMMENRGCGQPKKPLYRARQRLYGLRNLNGSGGRYQLGFETWAYR